MLFLMQMTKLKYSTKTNHSKVPLRFIKITVDYTEQAIIFGNSYFMLFREGVSCRILYSIVSYLCVSCNSKLSPTSL